MIKRLFFLKPIIAALLLTANCITYAAVPDSIRKTKIAINKKQFSFNQLVLICD